MRGQARSGVLDINGARLAYDDVGNGPAIVFLHAGVADRTMWDPQVTAFSPRCRCVRYDLRGFGGSDLPPMPFSSRHDLAAVLEALDVRDPVLVGCSLGGSVALDFAIESATATRAIVLVGTGLSGGPTPPLALQESLTAIDARAERGDAYGAAEASARLWLDGTRSAGAARGPLRQRFLRVNADLARREAAWLSEHEKFPAPRRLDPPAFGRLAAVSVPTLVIVGSADIPFVVETCRTVAAGVPGAELIVVEDAAHLVSLERPEPFNDLLSRFLARL